jgi:DNA-nicking Smr family endonuclease
MQENQEKQYLEIEETWEQIMEGFKTQPRPQKRKGNTITQSDFVGLHGMTPEDAAQFLRDAGDYDDLPWD